MNAVAIIDSNVVVAGILSRNSQSPVVRIIDGMLSANFVFAISLELLAEYHRALRYPKVAKLHGLQSSQIDDLLVELTLHAIVRDPPDIDVDIPDADDRFLFSLMHEFEQSVLVTGDKALLDHAPPWASVTSPSDFMALLDQP